MHGTNLQFPSAGVMKMISSYILVNKYQTFLSLFKFYSLAFSFESFGYPRHQTYKEQPVSKAWNRGPL